MPHPQKTRRTRSRTRAVRATERSPAEPPVAAEGAPAGMLPVAAPVIRRAILDPAYEDDVYDIEEGKRRAKVADMQGGRIKADDPRRSALTEHLLGSGRASGGKAVQAEPGRIGAKDARKSMLTEHLQGTGRATGLQFGGHDLPTQALGGERTAPISKHLVESGRVNIAFGAQATKEAQGLGTQVTGGDHSKIDAVAGKHPEQVDAKVEVAKEVEKDRTKKYLAEGRRYAGTERESAEVSQFDVAVARQDWVSALKLLEQIKTVAKDKLESANNAFTARKSDMSTAMGGLPYRLPANFRDMGKAMVAAHLNKEWLTVGALLKDLQRIVDLSLDFKARIEAVKKQAEGLTNPTQQKNLEGWIKDYETMPWATLEKNSSYEKGTVAFLEDRVNRYSGDAAKAEAAEKLHQERVTKGLISEKGGVIGEKKVDDLSTTNGEKAAVQAALDGLDTNTAPALTHNNGKKWGASFGNKDGDLPSGTYQEYYVEKDPASNTYHGNRRLVKSSKGKVYYTWTHYGDNGKPAFVRIR